VARSYNSKRRSLDYSFGKGWSMDSGPDVRLERTNQDDVVFHGPSGYDAFYERNADGSYVTPIGFDAKLQVASPSGWTYTENQSQRKLTFDVNGRLTRDEDRNGRAIAFTYVGSGSQLQKITDSQGRDSTFTYTSGRITQITDSGGRLYKYFYDASGRMTKYTDPNNGDTLYDYDAGDALQLITTPAGRKTKITYYPSGVSTYRVASVIRATNPTAAFGSLSGPTTQFAYTVNGYATTPPTTWPEESVVTDPLNHTVSTKFDKDSLPNQTRDGLNRLTKNEFTTNANVKTFQLAANTGTTPNTSFTYDADNNPTRSETPAASATADCSSSPASCLIDSASYQTSATVLGGKYLPSAQTDTEGKVTNLTYDAKGNPKTITKSNSTITLTYDGASNGKLTKITDAKNNDTTYGYDTPGNLTTITPELPLGPTTLTYTTAISRVATVKDGMNRTRTLSYDNLDRVTKITYSDGSYVQFVYDKDGNLTAQNDSVNGNMTATYDQLSRVLTQTKPGVTTTYTYDAAGNLKTIQDPGGTTTYNYDAANQNTSIQEPGVTGAITMDYDDDGMPTKTTYPNGVKVIARFDDANRTIGIFSSRDSAPSEGNAFQRYSYTYTTPGGTQRAQQQSMSDHAANRTTAYDYDGLSRLDLARTYTAGSTPPTGTCTAAPALACYDYALDAVGNRTALTVRGSTLTAADYTFAYNDANQLCWKKAAVVAAPTCATVPSGAAVYSHDADGNQTSNGAGRTLTYNTRDQTTSLAGTSASYLGAGQADLTALGGTTVRRDLVGLSTRATGGTDSYYTRALDGTVLTQRTGTSREYYSQDILGSVTALTSNATGAPTQATYAYDPDGNTTNTTGTSTSPFRYAGGYAAPGGLTHFGQRYYDPTDARWTQPDPLDQTGDLTDGNPYVYAAADPANLTDPSGACPPCKALGPVARAAGRGLSWAGRQAQRGAGWAARTAADNPVGRTFFERGSGWLNSNKHVRIGFGWNANKGREVFRIGTGDKRGRSPLPRGHLDLFHR
jgi:RHS repeat-associated protein